MAPENELLSPWREELCQQASQGSTAGIEEELDDGEKKTGRRRGSVAVKMAEGMTLFLETSWTFCAEKNWVSVCGNS